VFVLGTDSNIWTYGIHQGTLIGWSTVPSDQTNGQHVFFSSPPKAINPLSGGVPGPEMHVLAASQTGGVFDIRYTQSVGWFKAISIGGTASVPVHSPVGVTTLGSALDVLETTALDTEEVYWGSSWIAEGSLSSALGTNQPSGSPAIASWGSNREDAFVIDRQNRLLHAYFNVGSGSWRSDPANPIATDAVGDPVAVSRSSGKVEVFYRTFTGSLTHGLYNGASWTWQSNILFSNSIQ
jgi:hypothetical protein